MPASRNCNKAGTCDCNCRQCKGKRFVRDFNVHCRDHAQGGHGCHIGCSHN